MKEEQPDGSVNDMRHILYTSDDFTDEEIQRENKLTVMVIDGGLHVCKICGEYEAGLDGPCKARHSHGS